MLISAQGIDAIVSVINSIILIKILSINPNTFAAGRRMFPIITRMAPNTVIIPVKGTMSRFVNTDIIEKY